MFGAVDVARNPDHEGHRPPFVKQARDRCETGLVRFLADHCQRAGEAGFQFADGNADARHTKIEADDGAACG
jgi:hypothetical protein